MLCSNNELVSYISLWLSYVENPALRKGGHERRALAATFVGLQYTLYYWFRVVEVPVVRFQRTFWNVSVVEKAQLLRRQFRPTFWMTNRHLQTVRITRILMDQHLFVCLITLIVSAPYTFNSL